jgi:hypothetical protein
MTYSRENMESLGFAYMGPCSCRYAKGYIYRTPHNKDLELWVYPNKQIVKKRMYGITKESIGYNDETFETLVKSMGEL